MNVLTESESAALVDEDLALEAAREAFLAVSSGAIFPVVIGHAGVEGTRFALKSGSTAGLVGVKIGSFWEANASRGIPSHSSTTVLLDPDTGRVAAVVEAAAVNAYRTAAADALAVDALARPDAHTLAVFGTGNQAFHDVLAVARVRQLTRVLVVGRRREVEASFAARIIDRIGLHAEAADGQAALAAADIVVTATSSRQPLFDAAWVRAGTHISAMGADGPGKQELPVGVYGRAQLFCDTVEQSRTIGEFQHAPAEVVLTPLGSVLAGEAVGRSTPDDVTVFDSSGFALQDLTIAAALLRRHMRAD